MTSFSSILAQSHAKMQAVVFILSRNNTIDAAAMGRGLLKLSPKPES
jgi:hypothetical protein